MSLLNKILKRPGTGWRPDKPDSRDYDWSALGDTSDLPREVDLSEYEPESWDQSGTNSCVAQAVCAAIMMNDAQRYPNHLPFTPSRLYAYWNSRRQHRMHWVDKGTSIRVCAEQIRKVGCCDEIWWGWEPEKVNKKPDWLAYLRAAARWDYNYYKIKSTGEDRVKDVMAALAAGYPVVFGTLAPRDWLDGGGRLADLTPEFRLSTRKFIGGHAMLIVGYWTGPSGSIWFKVRNSWGPDWGNDGHIMLGEEWIKWENTRDLTVFVGGE